MLLLLLACATNPPPNTTPVTYGPATPGAYGPAPARIEVSAEQQPFAGVPLVTTPSGLKYWVLRPGSGAVPKPGQTAAMHYTGWLANGKKFDSSYDRGQPLEFTVGGGQVIKGWDEAVATMQVGEARRLEIPPHLGYGERGAGGMIPAGATLVFEVELIAVR